MLSALSSVLERNPDFSWSEMAGGFETPSLPTPIRHRPGDGRWPLFEVMWQSACPGLDCGLPKPRPVKPLLVLAKGGASQHSLPLQGVAGGQWLGFPLGGQDPGGSLEWGTGCFHASVCVCLGPGPPPAPPGQACSLAPLLSPALGAVRGPVVCSVEWKIPPRPLCESSRSHPLRLGALERNGSVFPLHGNRQGLGAGERGRGQGRPPSLARKQSQL